MNSQVSNLVLMLLVMQSSKKIPWEIPETLTYVRMAYIASNILIALVYFLVYSKIQKKDDQTTLKYVEPFTDPQTGGQSKRLVTTTIKDYDTQQLYAALKQSGIAIGMMAVMHFYFKLNQPLVIQSILPLKGVLENNLAKIHLYNKPASGDMKRPFKQPGLFGMTPDGPSTDKKDIEDYEKKQRGGAKEE